MSTSEVTRKMQDDDYKWFEENCSNLYRQYGNTYVAIYNRTVLGAYMTYAEAVNETVKAHELGSFIVQRCAESVEAYTVFIASTHFLSKEVCV